MKLLNAHGIETYNSNFLQVYRASLKWDISNGISRREMEYRREMGFPKLLHDQA